MLDPQVCPVLRGLSVLGTGKTGSPAVNLPRHQRDRLVLGFENPDPAQRTAAMESW